MKTYKIHLIRHGLTEGNLKQQYIGVTDLPLAGVGVTELKRLREETEYPRVDKVYSFAVFRRHGSSIPAGIFRRSTICER